MQPPSSTRPKESPSTRRRKLVVQPTHDMTNLRLPLHRNFKYEPHTPNEDNVKLPITPPLRLQDLFKANKILVRINPKNLREVPPPGAGEALASSSNNILQPHPPRRIMTQRRYANYQRGKHPVPEENIGSLDIPPTRIDAGLKRVPYKVSLHSPKDLSPILETPTPTPTSPY
jgi:hypothetical protein